MPSRQTPASPIAGRAEKSPAQKSLHRTDSGARAARRTRAFHPQLREILVARAWPRLTSPGVAKVDNRDGNLCLEPRASRDHKAPGSRARTRATSWPPRRETSGVLPAGFGYPSKIRSRCRVGNANALSFPTSVGAVEVRQHTARRVVEKAGCEKRIGSRLIVGKAGENS
jgi:hypothetical protein